MGKVKRVEDPLVGRIYYDKSCGSLVVVESIETNSLVTYRYLAVPTPTHACDTSWIKSWWKKIDVKKYNTW